MTEPARPPALPTAAVFDPEQSLWRLAERNERGVLHGAFATFRPGGGPLLRGSYVEGRPEGIWTRFTDDAPDAQQLRACCVPPGARELRTRYRAGVMLDETFYDARGEPLCDDGTPWPARHAGVPETATYEQSTARFVDLIERADGRTTLRYFSLGGALEEEHDVADGRTRARRRFEDGGGCVEETGFDDRGAPHGPYVARSRHGGDAFLDDRVRELRGQHEHGEAVGDWELRDIAGALLRVIRHGTPLDAEATTRIGGAVNERDLDSADAWGRAEADAGERPREALAAAARALAKSRDVARFERFLAERVARLRPETAAGRADAATTLADASPSSLLAALIAGAAPAVILRTLASSLAGHAPFALDYLDASLLIAPEQPMAGLARGLLCAEHGDPEGALAAASRLEADSQEAATMLREYVRITYDAFAFRPARDGVATPDEELAPFAAEQTLESVRRTVALYATRLGLVRNELIRRAGGAPAWLPPDPTALLPDGPLELARYTARIEDEGENGSEVTEVEVDETLAVRESTRRLLMTARGDWAALSWLCWSAGQDAVALPTRLTARPNFAAAAHQATVRCWRVHDRLRTAGLVALARSVQGFDWEGMPVDQVPTHLIDVAAAEYLEVRAQFMWLLFPQNQSPFQSDLRRV